MILRKPYAFLIKYFKVIHLILTVCVIYLISRVNGILEFYNNFIDGTVGKLGTVELFGSFYVFVVIFSIILCLVILMLMRYKNKNYLFYVVLIGYFLVTSLLINFGIDGLYVIYVSSMETKTLLLTRDIIKIFSFIQYIFLVMPLVRGLGFDIKKFNFVDDLVELNIDVDDDEEVELTVDGFENSQRKIHRNIREFKYYYLENKQIINLILVGAVVISGGIFLVNRVFLNPIYRVNDSFVVDNFTYRVLGSYVTNIGYDNNRVSGEDVSFVIVKMNISNNGSAREVNDAGLILVIDNKKYSPISMTSKFVDIGNVYNNQRISGSSTYLFAYKVSNDDIKRNMIFTLGNDKKVKLSPIYLDEVGKALDYKLNDNIDMSNTIFGVGNLKIKSCEVLPKFEYLYKYEVLDKEYDGKITISSVSNTIMHLVMESNYDSRFDNFSFLERYAKLKYEIDGVEHTSYVFENKTPSSYKEGLYAVVDKDVEEASSIYLDIVVRNKRYKYKLK